MGSPGLIQLYTAASHAHGIRVALPPFCDACQGHYQMNPLHEEEVWPLLRWKEPTC